MAFQFKCVGRSDASRVSRARRRCPCLCPRRRRHKHIHAYNARPRTLDCILYLYRYFNCILIYPRDSAPLLVTRTRELKGYIGRRAPGKCKLSAPVLANVSPPPPLLFFALSCSSFLVLYTMRCTYRSTYIYTQSLARVQAHACRARCTGRDSCSGSGERKAPVSER